MVASKRLDPRRRKELSWRSDFYFPRVLFPSQFVGGVNGGGVTLAALESRFQRHLPFIQCAVNEKVSFPSCPCSCPCLMVFTVTLDVKNSIPSEMEFTGDLCWLPVNYNRDHGVLTPSMALPPSRYG